jgi:lysyl-tRNA synthetase class 2
MLADIRAFFADRKVLEVETPVLSRAANPDPSIEGFVTHYSGPGIDVTPGHDHGTHLYLNTSPEFPMKRLLAAGSGDIYQICKVFRGGECGRLHNPEFTMLEWYRIGLDHHQLMREVETLVMSLLPASQLPLAVERLSYAELFQEYAGFDPHRASLEEIQASVAELAVGMDEAERDAWLDLVLTERVEPGLAQRGLVFVYDYPASQAALAQVHMGTDGVALAQRFELYLHGVELANGFHELRDAPQQAARFQDELARRQACGKPQLPVDQGLLDALAHGLPVCSGVALGLDRILMQIAGVESIQEAITFPLERA